MLHALEPLRATFVPLDRDEQFRAGRALVGFFREHGEAAAAREGLTYPATLDRLMSGHLDELG